MTPKRKATDKIASLDRLLEVLAGERRRGETVVFTNGCYDLLHVGHLHLLESAARLGDQLVVALNGDDSVRNLKGPGRPYVPFVERATMVASFEVVDWVVGFDDETPAALIEAIQPDVLVKGGDWRADRIVGREAVEARGGRVVSVPVVPDRSTTSLVERIRGASGATPRANDADP